VSASVSPPHPAAGSAGRPVAGRRPWYAAAGAAVVAVSLLPPAGTLALRYVTVESIQFTIFSMVAPALLVLGAPWRLLRPPGAGAGRGSPGLAGRIAARRGDQRSFLRAGVFLLVFMAATLLWRLSPVVDALARRPGLVAAELITLLAAGTGLWLELLDSPPLPPRLPRLQRAAIAAFAMWFVWAIAYVIGFHNGAVFTAYASVPGRAMSLVADQELAVVIMWAVPACCFIPLIATSMFGWLRDTDDRGEELQRIARDSDQRAVVKGWGAPGKSRARPGNG
jgi:cytochrome c oxidase assembly factor CtaG